MLLDGKAHLVLRVYFILHEVAACKKTTTKRFVSWDELGRKTFLLILKHCVRSEEDDRHLKSESDFMNGSRRSLHLRLSNTTEKQSAHVSQHFSNSDLYEKAHDSRLSLSVCNQSFYQANVEFVSRSCEQRVAIYISSLRS